VIFFVLLIVLGGWTFQVLWNRVHPAQQIRYIEALYDVLTMTFFQPTLDFPQEWFLDMYFFIMPILGVILIGRGAADFVTLLFNRRSRLSQWEEAVASTFRDHIIVCGLGHLGIRVVRELVALDEDIVVVEIKPDSTRFDEVRRYDIPIIVGDARNEEVLDRAMLDQASAIIIATNNDLANLQIASRIRERNKDIRIVMRMFDDQFARSMADRFDVSAVMSASMMAAPAFAGAATSTEIVQTFSVADRRLVMGRVEVERGSLLDGCCSIADIEEELDLSIVLLESNGEIDVHPDPERMLQAGDVIAVVGVLQNIQKMTLKWNRRQESLAQKG
jgi:voltage-gated potassium channel